MKNAIKWLGIITLVVGIGLSFTACSGDDGGGDGGKKTFTVTFDSNGGSVIPAQHVTEGGQAEIPSVSPIKGLAGLYLGEIAEDDVICTFDGWFAPDNETEFDFNTTLTGNITLTARWIEPDVSPINIDSQTGTGIIAKTVSYVNSNANKYTLLIDDDIDLSPQSLTVSGVNLTIIGIGNEREIRLSANGIMFTIGHSVFTYTNLGLTLGNNITLVGRSISGNGDQNNNNCVVYLRGGSSFTMLNGSKVTGNTSTSSSFSTGNGAAVYVSNGVFTMKDGSSITGNTATFSNPSTKTVAGLCHGGDYYITINMEGGSIIGNTAENGDASINCKVSLSGNATIGSLRILSYNYDLGSRIHCPIIVNPDWNGTVQLLSLHGGYSSIDYADMDTVINCWMNQPVLQAAGGYTLQKADVENILSLGNFFSSSNVTPQAISPDYKIEDSGTGIGKLVKVTP